MPGLSVRTCGANQRQLTFIPVHPRQTDLAGNRASRRSTRRLPATPTSNRSISLTRREAEAARHSAATIMSESVHFTVGDELDPGELALCGVTLLGADHTWGPEYTDQSDRVTCSACRKLLDDAGEDVTPDEEDEEEEEDDQDAGLDAMDELVAEELEDADS